MEIMKQPPAVCTHKKDENSRVSLPGMKDKYEILYVELPSSFFNQSFLTFTSFFRKTNSLTYITGPYTAIHIRFHK